MHAGTKRKNSFGLGFLHGQLISWCQFMLSESFNFLKMVFVRDLFQILAWLCTSRLVYMIRFLGKTVLEHSTVFNLLTRSKGDSGVKEDKGNAALSGKIRRFCFVLF